ncbi:hypothetical protein P3T37_001071 [Kitasatospora sp. MAA4]|uniref:hypothetical protein n=1 Tax=Kitasatospora sp. MAA4 TaxID=3035093 RepID=UPI00247407BD|nr:hypothetical protein [Kitasatospora sp. MAA4]MDH6131697.1 hypothetical protein [Kitasatospora sp. MAA4]
MSTRTTRLPALLLGAAGLALLPWIVVLAVTVRGSYGWVALDVAEAGCLLGAARLLHRGHVLHRPVAALAAALLTADACCDVRTAGPGAALLVAVLMALLAELPLAAFCATLALRPARRAPAGPAVALALAA